ncbi:MAG: response regulator [Proteobacteria bacterium]|nr:MAG: response regulator [Pseudomonadota bacterium]
MRAIVVDDSPTMRTMIKSHLNRLGYTVVGEGVNGVEGLELARTLRPDFMTLDIIMPEMDGIECYRHVRQLDNPPRTLLISVLAGEPRIISAYESEIYPTHFLKKPFSEKELKEKIDMLFATGAMPYPTIGETSAPIAAAPMPPPAPAPAPPSVDSSGIPPIPLN